jgi:carotenoid cleavage dioxygenase-like enzyme
MFTFGYQVDKAPHCIYRVVSKDGVMKDPVPITLPQAVMMHDFAITENYAIFMDLPLVIDGEVCPTLTHLTPLKDEVLVPDPLSLHFW